MNVTGPLPAPSPPRPDEHNVSLRLNQRFTAEVVQVTGDRVLLSVDGVPIVARMTSLEQAAQLIERRMATFVVREFAGQIVTLQLGRPPAGGAPQAQAPPAANQQIANLLRSSGLPVDQANLLLARALISQGLPVTPDLLAELRAALSKTGLATPAEEGQTPVSEAWGQSEAQIAAALKAAGLPVSSGTLALARSELAPLLETFSQLRTGLQNLLQTPLPEKLTQLVQNSLALLDEMVVDWSAPAPALADSLHQAISSLGRSLEKDLADMVRQGQTPDAEHTTSLMVLSNLRQELAQLNPNHPLLNELDRFLDSIRLRQFENSTVTQPLQKEQWLNLEFPVGIPATGQSGHQDLHPTRLKISYRGKGGERQVDPEQTRLVIQVDLDATSFLEVDLSVVHHQVGLWVKASSPELMKGAEEELPTFKDALDKIGFNLQSARCEVGPRSIQTDLTSPAPLKDLRGIDLAV